MSGGASGSCRRGLHERKDAKGVSICGLLLFEDIAVNQHIDKEKGKCQDKQQGGWNFKIDELFRVISNEGSSIGYCMVLPFSQPYFKKRQRTVPSGYLTDHSKE